MRKEMPVSCIVPVHNAEDYLREFMDSLINQTFEEIEIICVDDASTDSSLSILLEYQKQKDISIIKNESNLGAAETRNRGLSVANGDYVVFLDCDDILHREMIAEMYHSCQKNAADLCICHQELFTGNKHIPTERFARNRVLVPTYPVIEDPLHFRYIFQIINNRPTDKMIRRKILMDNCIRFQSLPCSNDIYYSYVIALCSNKIIFNDKVLYYVRNKRINSITSTWRGKKNFDCEAFDAIYDFLKRREYYELARESFTKKVLKDIYIGIESFSEQYREETITNLKEIYFSRWEILRQYEHGKLSAIQETIVDIITQDKEYLPYYSILLSCSELKVRQLISSVHKQNKKIVWWGAGKKGLEFLTYIHTMGQRIDYVVDRDIEKLGKRIAGYSVMNWDSVQDDADVIFVVSDAWIDDIRAKIGSAKEILNIISYLEY